MHIFLYSLRVHVFIIVVVVFVNVIDIIIIIIIIATKSSTSIGDIKCIQIFRVFSIMYWHIIFTAMTWLTHIVVIH